MNTQDNYIPCDFHCHSTHSDGAFTVHQVLDMAKANGCKYLALTDHDTVNGIPEAIDYAQTIALNFIPGVEISVTWNNNLIHIVGLGIDATNQTFINNLNNLRSSRYLRGQKIAEKLARIGIPNALEGAMQYCSNIESLSRTHFSRFLVDTGYAKPGKAFEKYLAPGKAGYVTQTWATLKDAVSWITDSDGLAVIAHPCRYKFTRTKLIQLIEEFKSYGGLGIEVISSAHSTSDAYNIATLANSQGLFCSLGSDFHNLDDFRRIKVGVNPRLPSINCKPIYTELGISDL